MTTNTKNHPPKISDTARLLDPVPEYFGKPVRVLIDELNDNVPSKKATVVELR